MTIIRTIRDMQDRHLGWLALWLMATLASSCSTATLTQRTVDISAKSGYRSIHTNVTLPDAEETTYLSRRLIEELERRGLHAVRVGFAPGLSAPGPEIALLTIDELDRRIETVESRRNFGRTSLTMMRGRELREKPVITLRATLIDSLSGRTVFQADFITQGPWYADSSQVVGVLPTTLVEQLTQLGFI